MNGRMRNIVNYLRSLCEIYVCKFHKLETEHILMLMFGAIANVWGYVSM